MMNLFRKLHKNNRGSSMIVVIIAIAFIGVLVSIIMVSSVTSYRMKVVDNNSRHTFYEADAVLDEIYNGLGQECYTALSDAYIYESTHLIDSVTGNYASNESLNVDMKVKYLNYMIKTLSNDTISDVSYISTATVDQVKTHLTKIVNDAAGSTPGVVISVNLEHVKYDTNTKVITLEDVSVSCTSTDYVSYVTTDIEIKYPELTVSFIKEGSIAKEYLEYALIGLTGVSAGKVSTQNNVINTVDQIGYVELNGSMYAGNLLIRPQSTFAMTNGTLINSANTHIFNGVGTASSYASSLTLNGVNMWTSDIFLGEEGYGSTGNGASFIVKGTVEKDSNLYVQDDTTLNGDYAHFEMQDNSSYYGYTPSGNDRSAIIVNGLHANLNLNYKNMLVAGTAEIADTHYITGDSVAIKGFQELYMVPAKYLDGSENPSEVTSQIEHVELDGFYAYTLGLVLNETDMKPSADNKTRYYYFVFPSALAQRSFLYSIMTYDASARSFSYLDPTTGVEKTVINISEDTAHDLNLLKSSLYNTMNKFGYIGVHANGNGATNTYGTISEIVSTSSAHVSQGTGTLTMENVLGYGDNVNSVSEYYTIMKEYLGYKSDYYINGKNAYFNILNVDEIEKTNSVTYTRDYDNNPGTGKNGAEQIVALIKGTNYVVPTDYTSGLIVAYGCDVILNHDFEGLIITDTTIYLYGNVHIKANSEMIKNILDDNYDEFKSVARLFRAYMRSNDELTLANPNMEDMIQFTNWRKNDVQ